MRWLLIVLFVSLGGLLLAAAGVALHIRLQRAKLRRKPAAGDGTTPTPDSPLGPVEETEIEPEN
jgi:hypothetical protein